MVEMETNKCRAEIGRGGVELWGLQGYRHKTGSRQRLGQEALYCVSVKVEHAVSGSHMERHRVRSTRVTIVHLQVTYPWSEWKPPVPDMFTDLGSHLSCCVPSVGERWSVPGSVACING